MIKFVLSDTQKNMPEDICYYFNRIKIGSHHLYSDLVIDNDSVIQKVHLEIKIKPNNTAQIASFKEDIFFHINDKKVIGSVVLKIGDIVKIGQSKILIKEISYTEVPELSQLKQNLSNAIETHPEIGDVLMEIQNEIVHCEKLSHE